MKQENETKKENIMADSAFGEMIRETMYEAGLEPVEFERPLKIVGALARLRKCIEPENVSVRHSAVGWCIGTILDQFEKDLFNVKSLVLCNNDKTVTVEVFAHVMARTFVEDHVAWFDGLLECMSGDDYPAHGYAFTQRYWRWDSVERVGDVTVFIQQCGDGRQTKLAQEAE